MYCSITFFVSADCIYVISLAPELAVPVFVFEVCMAVEYHQRTFSFQIPHKRWHAEFWRDAHQHVDMVRAGLCFKYFYVFVGAKRSYDFPYVHFDFPIYGSSAVFGGKHYMVFAVPSGFTDTPPSYLVWLANPHLFYTRRSYFLIICFRFFWTTGIARGFRCTKTPPSPWSWRCCRVEFLPCP